MAYLKDTHKVHKLGWWRSRDVKPIGLGTDPPPDNETGLPPGPRGTDRVRAASLKPGAE